MPVTPGPENSLGIIAARICLARDVGLRGLPVCYYVTNRLSSKVPANTPARLLRGVTPSLIPKYVF